MSQQINGAEDLEVVRRKFLRPEELFLMEFLKGFDRRTTKEWKEQGLWDTE